MQILNLTQHIATSAQIEQNVVEFSNKQRITDLLTFNKAPTKATIRQRAELLADIAMEHFQAVFDDGVFETDMFRAAQVFAAHPATFPTAAKLAHYKAMIGGAPYLMAELEKALWNRGIEPVYSFSERKSVETEKDGIVTKVNVFEHAGFVSAIG